MPIAGLICRSCLRVVEPNGLHWLNECEQPNVNPGIVQSGVDSESHLELVLTPTTVLGKVRDQFLQRTFDYYPEAQGFNTREIGTAVAERMEKAIVKASNGRWQRQVTFKGELWGEKFEGTCDLLFEAGEEDDCPTHITDNKMKGEGAFGWARSRGFLASDEDSAQLSMLAELAAQNGVRGAREAVLNVWYNCNSAAQKYIYRNNKRITIDEAEDPGMRARARMMSLDEIAEMRPGGSKSTVLENVRLLAAAFGRVRAGEDPRAVQEDIGMLCDSSFGGKACKWYCDTNRVCFGLRGRALSERNIIGVRLPEPRVNVPALKEGAAK